jgi:hypothetical protein
MFNKKKIAAELFRTFFKNTNQIPWKLFDHQSEGRGDKSRRTKRYKSNLEDRNRSEDLNLAAAADDDDEHF